MVGTSAIKKEPQVARTAYSGSLYLVAIGTSGFGGLVNKRNQAVASHTITADMITLDTSRLPHMARIYGALGFLVSNTLDAGMGGLTLNIGNFSLCRFCV
jgi:hypothetical protein